MLIDDRVHKVLKLEDINSLISFEEWVKDNLSLYKEGGKVPSGHLKVFLEYIQQDLNMIEAEQRRDWKEKVKTLLERVEGK